MTTSLHRQRILGKWSGVWLTSGSGCGFDDKIKLILSHPKSTDSIKLPQSVTVEKQDITI